MFPLFVFLFHSPVFSSPELLTFPVRGMVTAEPGFVQLAAEWTDSYLTDSPAADYNHALARVSCILASASYSAPGLFPEAMQQCYDVLGIERGHMAFYYDVDYNDPELGNDQCAFSFAYRNVPDAGGTKTILYVVIRCNPTPGIPEWLSSFDVGITDGEARQYHKGFYRAAKQVESSLVQYLNENAIDAEKTSVLITGHSRGAAIANLLAAFVIDRELFLPSHVYAYTFATPNVTTRLDATESRFASIWNICNGEDCVSLLPLKRKGWQYQKFGNTRILRNAWNGDPVEYENELLPRINAVYRTFMRRDVMPFKTGSFYPIQMSRLLAEYNENVRLYYTTGVGCHSIASRLLKKYFPEDDSLVALRSADSSVPQNADEFYGFWDKRSQIPRAVLNKIRPGAGDFIQYGFIDMHANEAYISQLVALSEDEAFSITGSTEFVLSGTFNCVVVDSHDEVMVRIRNQHVDYNSIRLPVAAMQLSLSDVVIGFPSTGEYRIIVTQDSLLPSPVFASVEHYDESGLLSEESPLKILLPHSDTAYLIAAGHTSRDMHEVAAEKRTGKAAAELIRKYGLSDRKNLSWQFEAAVTSDGLAQGGIRFGESALYGNLRAGFASHRPGRTFSLLPGIGTEWCVIGVLYASLEGSCGVVFDDDRDEPGVMRRYLVPSGRLSFAVKPRTRLFLFCAVNYDIAVDGFNRHLFDCPQQNHAATLPCSSSIQAIPTLQFGLRF